MRRFLAALLAASLTLPLIAAETPLHKARTPIPAASAPAGLRGPQAAAKGQLAPPLLAALPAAPVGTVQTPLIDPHQCRAACAHTYYFCLSGEDAPSCPEAWSRCTSACDSPTLTP